MADVIVVGGGAAGLMAAVSAAEAGASVTLLERNEKLGKKIYITGKGRCNVTNACTPEDFQKQVVHNPRFLFSALNALPSQAFMDRLSGWGCPVKTERGDRVFPESEKASDVTRAFERQLSRLGVKICFHTRVKDLLIANESIKGVLTEDGKQLFADAVILCTGGKSYLSTGSSGDGYALLANCGHTLLPPLPALIPLCSPEPWVYALQGLSLKNVRVTLRKGRKILFSDIGEMLFTHFGFSGPLILSASSYMTGLPLQELTLELDLKPGLTERQLDDRLVRDIAAVGKKQLQTILYGLLPSRLAETMPALCGLDGRSPANALLKEERAALAAALKALPLPVSGTRPLNEAIITRGGVNVREVSPSTMESKLIKGLYIAGELLDVDALTGGFNLHIAFSTGFLAGFSGGSSSPGQ